MSISDKSQQKMFKKKTGENEYHGMLPDSTKDHGGWAEMWPRWHKAMKALKVDKKKQDLAQAGLKQLSDDETAALRDHLKPILEKILQIGYARANLQPALAKPDASQLKETLQTAIFGAARKTKADVQHTDAVTMTGRTNYETCCDITPGRGKAKSVAAAVACLCAKASANAVDGACRFSIKPSTAWNPSAAVEAGRVKQPLAFCPGTTDESLTRHRLDSILSALKRQMKIISSHGYLGELHTTSCGCKNNDGLCVKYTSFTGKDGKAFEDIPWVMTLSTLVSELKERKKAAIQASFLAEQLIAEKDTAYSLAETTKQAENLVEVTSDGEGTGSKQQSGDCMTHKDNKTVCEKTEKCKWEGKTGNSTNLNLKREKDRKHNKQRHQIHNKGQINSNVNYNPNAPRLLNENGKIMLAEIPLFS
uniref:Variant surface glycoprotein 1125.3069 n=1 Tax=Trypanosoma brucei TaxID=5691 RepID=A0A1J0R966_9TRYP|nr:variant surface glycoprotein 1125.3069 [Trypanosoma brucei]